MGRFAKPQARCGSLPGKRSRASILKSSRSARLTLLYETEGPLPTVCLCAELEFPRFIGEPVLSGGRVGGGSFVGGFRVGRLVAWLAKPVALGRFLIVSGSRGYLTK